MSEANASGSIEGQGRFGPPPCIGFTVTAYVEHGDRWHLVVTQRLADETWERTITWSDTARADVIEAVVVETYRALRGG